MTQSIKTKSLSLNFPSSSSPLSLLNSLNQFGLVKEIMKKNEKMLPLISR